MIATSLAAKPIPFSPCARALYTDRYGEQLSKLQAAEWAEQEYPQWASLIQNTAAVATAYGNWRAAIGN